MRSIILAFISIYALNQLFFSCASPSTIDGGPRDTIPPVLLEAIPPNGQVDFNSQSIRLIFSEDINADKLKQELIITPYFENEYKYLVKKQTITIDFEKPFPDSTTYILNFANGIGDLNENNPVVNLKYAFSTGTFIDSLTLSGYVYDLMTNEPAKNYLVSLYDQDTSSVFIHKPTYFAYANDEGIFNIQNIRAGRYHVYAFDDDNKNLILEPSTEMHGLLTDTLRMDTASLQIEIPVILQDASTLTLVRERAQSNRYDVRYSKYIKDFEIHLLDTIATDIDKHLVENQEVIRFYPSTKIENDSIGYIITVSDSLGTSTTDTLFIKFEGNAARREKFDVTIKTNNQTTLSDTTLYEIIATKPIQLFDPSLLQFKVDTVLIPFILDMTINFAINRTKTVLTFKAPKLFPFVAQYLDSLSSTFAADTLTQVADSTSETRTNPYPDLPRNTYDITFAKGWLISIERDTAASATVKMSKPTSGDVGLVRGSIYTTEKSYFLELITKTGKVIASLDNPKSVYEFRNVPPGSYSIRVKIDKNEDGVWSYGNIRLHTAPEPIYYMEEYFDIRANWELEKIDLSF